MAINLSAVGRTFGPVPMPYTPRDVMTYALAVGADETELPFVYELYGPLVVPSFAAVPSFKAAVGILTELGIEGRPTVHGEQRLRLVRSIPPTGTFDTELRVNGIYDKGSGALNDMSCRTSVGGEAVCDNALTFFVLGEGGFGGERGPKADRIEPPA